MRQRDQLSSKLYTSTVHKVFKYAQLEEKGINVDGGKLSYLISAENSVLTTERIKDLEHWSNVMNEESLLVGLEIRKGKTKLMINSDTANNVGTDQTKKIEGD